MKVSDGKLVNDIGVEVDMELFIEKHNMICSDLDALEQSSFSLSMQNDRLSGLYDDLRATVLLYAAARDRHNKLNLSETEAETKEAYRHMLNLVES